MLRHRKYIPLDYSLCTMTVTVYHREGLTRQVMEGVHLEWTDRAQVDTARETAGRSFLLVVPGHCAIAPGDKVVAGIGPALTAWTDLNSAAVPELGVAASVQKRWFRGRPCHTEVRG